MSIETLEPAGIAELSGLEILTTPELGDNSYLLADGADAALIDPQRDAWRALRVASSRGLRIKFVLETHVHNDYVSGALEISSAGLRGGEFR